MCYNGNRSYFTNCTVTKDEKLTAEAGSPAVPGVPGIPSSPLVPLHPSIPACPGFPSTPCLPGLPDQIKYRKYRWELLKQSNWKWSRRLILGGDNIRNGNLFDSPSLLSLSLCKFFLPGRPRAPSNPFSPCGPSSPTSPPVPAGPAGPVGPCWVFQVYC